MSFNPCGFAVEYLRESIADHFLPFRDSPLVMKRKWFRVAEGTPFLPFPTAFYSGRWEPFVERPRAVGVTYPPDVEYLKPQTLTGFTLEHYCGTPEDFARGAVFDPSVNQQYDADWIPTCCERVAVCVFQLCSLGQLNDWPYSLLTTYPVTQQSAVDTTPAVTQQLATNGGDTSPPTAQFTVEFRPGGALNPHGVSVVMSGDTAGEPAAHQTTVRTADDTAVTRTQTSTAWKLNFESPTDSAEFKLEWVARVLTLRGTNLAIDPALIPPPPPPPPPDALSTEDVTATGADQASAAPLTAAVNHVFTDSDAKGVALPVAARQLLFLVMDSGSSESGCKLYPESGESINGGTADAPVDIISGKIYVCKALGEGSQGWNVAELSRFT